MPLLQEREAAAKVVPHLPTDLGLVGAGGQGERGAG